MDDETPQALRAMALSARRASRVLQARAPANLPCSSSLSPRLRVRAGAAQRVASGHSAPYSRRRGGQPGVDFGGCVLAALARLVALCACQR